MADPDVELRTLEEKLRIVAMKLYNERKYPQNVTRSDHVQGQRHLNPASIQGAGLVGLVKTLAKMDYYVDPSVKQATRRGRRYH